LYEIQNLDEIHPMFNSIKTASKIRRGIVSPLTYRLPVALVPTGLFRVKLLNMKFVNQWKTKPPLISVFGYGENIQ
jgi:hypothetical protein